MRLGTSGPDFGGLGSFWGPWGPLMFLESLGSSGLFGVSFGVLLGCPWCLWGVLGGSLGCPWPF